MANEKRFRLEVSLSERGKDRLFELRRIHSKRGTVIAGELVTEETSLALFVSEALKMFDDATTSLVDDVEFDWKSMLPDLAAHLKEVGE